MAFRQSKNTKQKTDRVVDQDIGVEAATVTDDPDVENHRIPIRIHLETGGGVTLGERESAHMMIPTEGDVALPDVGDTVVVARFSSQSPVVLGTIYTQNSPPPTDNGDERHIGSDDNDGTHIRGPFGVVPKVDSNPSDPPDGAVWYRTDIGRYKGVQSGSVVTFEITSHSH